MKIHMMKCKLHGAHVTDANLNYEGSVGIPRDLMDAAGLLPHEQVQVLNFRNGERLTTYVLEYPAKSGHIVMNGPAAHKIGKGDKIIIIAYGEMSKKEAKKHTPKVVLLDAKNRIKKTPSLVMIDPKRKANRA